MHPLRLRDFFRPRNRVKNPFGGRPHHRHVQEKLQTLDIWAGPLSDVRTRLLEGAQVGAMLLVACLTFSTMDQRTRTTTFLLV